MDAYPQDTTITSQFPSVLLPASSGQLKRQRSFHAAESPDGRKRARGDQVSALSSTHAAAVYSPGPAMFSGVNSVQTFGGSYTVAGGNVTIHNHHHYPAPIHFDLLKVFKLMGLPNFRLMQQATLAKATKGTCLWFTEGGTVEYWIEDDKSKILWGTGIPGAGKTVLASLLINHIGKLEEESEGSICLAYVFIRYSQPLSVQDILQSLVKQIVERHEDVVPLVERLYKKHRREGTNPSPQDLLGVLSTIITLGKRLFFILDALDELLSTDRRNLIDLLSSLDAKLFITSRPHGPLMRQFPEAHFFDIAAHPSDVRLLVQDAIRQSPELSELLEFTDLEDYLTETVCNKSKGMFLHATLQLKALQQCVNAQDLEDTLEQFPADLETVYRNTWNRIVKQSGKHFSLAKHVFLWIMFARQDLTIDELRHAVAVSPQSYVYDPKLVVPDSLLVSVCCGLVSMEDEGIKRVRLIHYTVKDAILPLISELFPNPHDSLALVCITHLEKRGLQCSALENVLGLYELFGRDPLVDYSHRSWDFHAHASLPSGSAAGAAAEFILHCKSFPTREDPWTGFNLLGPLHMASYHGFESLINQASQLQSPNDATSEGITALHLACAAGKKAAAENLLALVNININQVDEGGWTALMFAAYVGHVEIVKLLLNTPGVDVDWESDDGESAISLASEEGFEDIVNDLRTFLEERNSHLTDI